MLLSLKPLFIFEMANNHNGSVERGLKIISDLAKVVAPYNDIFDFAVKFQYRNLETFIHPEYKDRLDLKFVKRFKETELCEEDFIKLHDFAKQNNFLTVCTAFDEKSVDTVQKHGYDIIKIASCSFTDWPLLEKIALCDLPIIASVAGSSLSDMKRVVQFFKHRDKNLSLMHCVAEYPTKPENIQLNQIDFLKENFKDIPIGFSTHESPDNTDIIKMAIAKHATLFEKHVGLADYEGSINKYSATPEQVAVWLEKAKEAYIICGGKENERCDFPKDEIDSLKNLSRAVFASKDIKKGESIDNLNTYLAIPSMEGQLFASDLSKYKDFTALSDIPKNAPIMVGAISEKDTTEKVSRIITAVRKALNDAKIILPNEVSFEISHHYGLDKFDEVGAVIINCINRQYCKKLLVVMPNQRHPAHLHKIKEETFQILHGELEITVGGESKVYKPGDIVLVNTGVMHSFSSKTGAIFEEISTKHIVGDSYYEDVNINENKKRKTNFTYWLED